MSRLTKREIESSLLKGSSIPWGDPKKRQSISLDNARSRRLFQYLLSSDVRVPKDLPKSFVEGLKTAFQDTKDPAEVETDAEAIGPIGGPWKLAKIESKNFGGINTWNGPPFSFELESESLLLSGPNGSGKSSIVAAIIWALLGESPSLADSVID